MKYKLNILFISFITIISAMGGLLFGYDWVVIGGAKPFYEPFFGITGSPTLQGWAMSSAIVGCLVGAIISGTISDKYGRKIPLIIASLLFTWSAIGTGAANSFFMFVVYRLIGGFGIGMASVLSPIYIAEIAPAHLRGRLVSINQLTIVIGILMAQIVNYQIAEVVPEGATVLEITNSWNGQTGWRWMFWAEAVLSVSFFLLVFVIPESPRWQIKAGKKEAAFKTLQKVGGKEYALEAEKTIQDTVLNETVKVDYKALKSPKIKKIIFIGVVLAVLQQMCGINVIFNYADEIFRSAGYGVSDMLFNVVITGGVNLTFTLVALRIIDKWGRRKMMLLGFGGLAVLYLFFGGFYHFEQKGLIMLISVLVGIGIYAMTLAPTTWVVLSEIFPNKVRGLAMSIATLGLWSACFLLTYTFPIINKGMEASGTFWLYGAICFLGFLFIKRYLPETKGKSLEEIENEFNTKKGA